MEKKSFRVLRETVWETLRTFPKGHHREGIVLLYLESGPVTDWTGLFSAPPVDIAYATGLDVAEVEVAITNLNHWGHIVYDFDRRVVFVKGLLFRQARYRPNYKQAMGIIRHVGNFSEISPAVQAFFSEHSRTPSLARYFPNPGTPVLADTSSRKGEGYPIPHSDGVSKGTPKRIKKQQPRKKKRETNVTLPSEAVRSAYQTQSDTPSLEPITAMDEQTEPMKPIQQTGPIQQEDAEYDMEGAIYAALAGSGASPVPAVEAEPSQRPTDKLSGGQDGE